MIKEPGIIYMYPGDNMWGKGAKRLFYVSTEKGGLYDRRI